MALVWGGGESANDAEVNCAGGCVLFTRSSSPEGEQTRAVPSSSITTGAGTGERMSLESPSSCPVPPWPRRDLLLHAGAGRDCLNGGLARRKSRGHAQVLAMAIEGIGLLGRLSRDAETLGG